MYPGNTSFLVAFGDRLHLGGVGLVYLYHGIYGNTYGAFYLTQKNYNDDRDRAFMQIYDGKLGEYIATLTGITVSPSPSYLSNLINSSVTGQYFDVIPSSWLSYIRSKITNTRYNLCFIPQSDLEEWLNAYWKYEPNK